MTLLTMIPSSRKKTHYPTTSDRVKNKLQKIKMVLGIFLNETLAAYSMQIINGV